MPNSNINVVAVILVWAALFVIGFFLGYKLKHCPATQVVVHTTDTQWYERPIVDTPKHSVPTNLPIPTFPISKPAKAIHDTTFIVEKPIPIPTYVQVDTLSNNGIKVAILDSGNCNGVYSRVSKFFGQTSVPVVTNTIEKPFPLFSIYAGANMSFINTKINTNYRFQAFDFGPTLGLNIKGKAQATYQYGIKTNQHNLSVQVNIK